jgi:hypothetical protein
MCGLYGFDAPGLTVPERVVLCASLAHANDSRGGQAWGVVTETSEITKGLGNAGAESWRLAEVSASLAGHTRWATHGDAKDLGNAHPFTHGSIIGMHNGVFYNHGELNVKRSRDFKVDSQHIFEDLANGVDTSDIKGYGVIVWREEGKPGFFLCKLTDRGELSIGTAGGTPEAPHVTAWSSTKDALKAALAAVVAGREITYWAVETGQVYQVTGGKCWQITGRKITIAPEAGRSWDSYFADDDKKTKGDPWAKFAKDRKKAAKSTGGLAALDARMATIIEDMGLTDLEVADYVSMDGLSSTADALGVDSSALADYLDGAGFTNEVEQGEEVDAQSEILKDEEDDYSRFTEATME